MDGNTVFEKNMFVMLLIDPDTAQIIDANEAACRFYGYSKEILSSMKITDINVTYLDEDFLEEIEDIKRKGYGKLNFNHKLASGEIRNVDVYSSPIEIGDRKLLHSIIYDITENKIKEKEIRKNKEKYYKLFNNIDDAIFMIDPKNKFKYIEVNDAACKWTGYTRKELLNMSPRDLRPDHDSNKTFININNVMENKHHTFQTEIKTKLGNIIPIEINAHLFKLDGRDVVLAVCRDITERKEILRIIEESEERYRKLIASMPDAVFLHHDEKFIFANESGAKLLGVNRPEELYGKSIWEFTTKDYITHGQKWIDIATNEDIVIPLVSQQFVKSDGKVIDVEMTNNKFSYGNKDVILNIVRDITERKKTQNKLAKVLNENKILLDKTLEYDKLKNEFFANISHELKTPLNIIFSINQLFDNLLNDCNCDIGEKLKKYNNVTKQNCYRLHRLINNIIDVTRIEGNFFNMEFNNYNIVKTVEDIVLSVSDYIDNKGIDIIFDTEIEEKIIKCDVDKVERIILNLLSNSIKFTEKKGKIYVNIYDKDDAILISIKDTGIGIPKDKQEVIFDRFRQVDSLLTRKNEGSGIGLSLVKALVKAHDGDIKVKSELGVGTEFLIELPVNMDKGEELNYKDSSKDGLIERISIEFSDIYQIN